MLIQERLQTLIHLLEVGFGVRLVRWVLILVVLAALLTLYDTRAYHSFNAPEAMDAAQVARSLSEGHGFTTEYIRPFSIYLVQKHNRAMQPAQLVSTNFTDAAQVYAAHPDLANAPLYPLVLAGMMKALTPQWKAQTRKPFWSDGGGNFRRYQPEFYIAILNQMLLVAVVLSAFAVARKLFDPTAAWLAASLTLGFDVLWKFSVSGQSTMLLMVILLALTWCLINVEESGREENPGIRRMFLYALLAGVLTGLGMLTRYSFGWLIVPVIIFVALFGGTRRARLSVTVLLSFGLVGLPWILRNLSVSGTMFGTAGYAIMEGTSIFPGNKLLRSLNPDMYVGFQNLALFSIKKLLENSSYILGGDIFRLGGGWLGIFFFAGMFLGLRNTTARRLRHFTLMCLGMLIVIQALGQTQLSSVTPDINSENLLVLLTPLVVIFGVAFFLTLLDQLNLPSLVMRWGMMLLLMTLIWQPLGSTLILESSTMSYPPYYPPDVQKIAGWMRPEELIMSDIPWAVAWYGDRQCVWVTMNSQYEFFALNDYVKPVHGLYLSLNTLDAKLFTECLQGGVNSWGFFSLYSEVGNQLPTGFPLRNFPLETLRSGLFLTDRQRW